MFLNRGCVGHLISATIPSLASFTKYREDVIAVVLPCIVYLLSGTHVSTYLYSMTVCHSKNSNNKNFHCTDKNSAIWILSSFLLHMCAHGMYHCMVAYRQNIACRVRHMSSGSLVFLCVTSLGLVGVHLCALITPAVLYMGGFYYSLHTLKDVVVVQALTAFMPECLGVAFTCVLKVLQKLLDSNAYDTYM